MAVLAAAGGLLVWHLTRHPADEPTTLPRASCGQVSTNRFGPDTTVFPPGVGVLRCFTAAARACRAASIGVTDIDTDVGTNYVFTLEPGRTPCRVTDLSQFYSANFGGSTGPIVTTSCSRRVAAGIGVLLRCAGQDLLIPATVTPPGPLIPALSRASCGSAMTRQLASNTRILSAGPGALRCFSTAVRTCRPASLEVVQTGAGTGADYVFIVQPGGERCPVLRERQAYAASLGGWKGPVIGTICHRITASPHGVVLACARQNVLIPATAATPRR